LKTHITHGRDGCRWKHCCTSTEVNPITDIRGGGDHLRFFAVPATAPTPSASPRRTRSGRLLCCASPQPQRLRARTDWIPEPILRQRPGGPEAITKFFETSYQCADYIQTDNTLYSATDPHVRHECLGEHRCPHCCDTFPSALELKAHCKSRICPRILNRDRKSATVKDVHYFWRKAVDQTEPVLMDGDAIKEKVRSPASGYLVLRLAPKNATDTRSCLLWRCLLNYRRHETGLDRD
jgi:hypothetical protein